MTLERAERAAPDARRIQQPEGAVARTYASPQPPLQAPIVAQEPPSTAYFMPIRRQVDPQNTPTSPTPPTLSACTSSPVSTSVAGVRESVIRDFLPTPTGARACLVHLHRDEQNALRTSEAARRTRCINFVHLSGSGRPIHLTRAGGGPCNADPNRIFTQPGRDAQARSCPRRRRSDAIATLGTFNTELSSAIEQCRAGASGPLPVVAVHNNSPGPPTTVSSLSDTSDIDAQNPGASTQSAEGRDDFALTTRRADYDALRALGHNAALQVRDPATDDGSLSVAFGQRSASAPEADQYINIETMHRTGDAIAADLLTDTLDHLGVPSCTTGCAAPPVTP